MCAGDGFRLPENQFLVLGEDWWGTKFAELLQNVGEETFQVQRRLDWEIIFVTPDGVEISLSPASKIKGVRKIQVRSSSFDDGIDGNGEAVNNDC